MALPMSNTPIYNLVIPSTGKEFKYRPFLVKEEKALLIAQQSEELQVMVDSLKDVIKSCAKSDLDVDSLATFDLEYIFTQIRAKSVGEQVELIFACDEDHGNDNDKAKVKVNIDLSKIEITKPESHETNISLFEDVGVTMKYPTMDVIKNLESVDDNNIDEVFDLVSSCIETIYNTDEVFHIKEQTKEEVIEFLNNLTSEQFGKIQNFFQTMPKMTYKVEYDCPICQKKNKQVLEGLQSFF